MTRRILRYAAPLALLAAPAFADEPSTISMPSSEIAHVVQLLRFGGTRAEADALAESLIRSAQTDMAKQQAPKPAAPAEPPK